MAGGVSTSGWAYKYPGRLGDSPVIGAGLYVDERYGAAACTHTGEMTIRAGTARLAVALGGSVDYVWRMPAGKPWRIWRDQEAGIWGPCSCT